MSLLRLLRISIIVTQRNLRAIRNVFPLGAAHENITANQHKRKVEFLDNCFVGVFVDGNDDSTLEQSIFHTYDGRECMGLSNSQCRSTADWPVFVIRAPRCATKKAGIGGIFSFFGFGCSVCNKFLMLLFSSTFILTYFEPVRHYVGVLGILLFSHALLQKLLLRHAVLSEQSFNGEVPAGAKKM